MYDIEKIRKEFPMLNSGLKMQNKPLVFLDNCSTTLKPYAVIAATDRYYSTETSNSHRGDYDLCYNMDVEIDKTRKLVAEFVNSDVNEVVFTYGTTMSINTIAYGYAMKFLKKGDEILVSEQEHASNLLPWYKVARQVGAVIKTIPLDEKLRITIDNFKSVISDKTKIVAIAHVGNVMGYENPVVEMAKIAHEYGAIIAVDGAQSVPHMKVDFKNWDFDFLSFSAHKMCGPTGIGVLVGKHELLEKMDSFISGGGMNVSFDDKGNEIDLPSPAKFEAGTLNLAGIVGFKAAIEFINSIGIENVKEHDIELHNYVVNKLEGHDNVIIYNKDAEGAIITFNLKGVFAQDEATLLNSKGIAVRSGQHCAKAFTSICENNATVRMSTYLYTNKEEVDIFIDALLNGGDILDAYFS